MAKKEINPKKIVVFTGAGISEESGIPTFRFGEDSFWNNVNPQEVATAQALKTSPERVREFLNEMKRTCLLAEPNAAHIAIAELEKHYEVVVVTTNLDNLHEKAGSTHVIHLHGNLSIAKSTEDSSIQYNVGDKLITPYQKCELGSPLRHDVVLFGEEVPDISTAREHFKDAAKVLVVGSSLSVKPACNVLKAARGRAEKLLVTLQIDKVPFGFRHYPEKAALAVPQIANRWTRNS